MLFPELRWKAKRYAPQIQWFFSRGANDIYQRTFTGDTQFDVLLCNINRNVILSSLETLKHKMNNESIVVFSGIMADDISLVEQHLKENGYQIQEIRQKEEWMLILAQI